MLNLTTLISQSLFRLKADPANPQLLDEVNQHIENYGIDFYKAVIQHFPVVTGSKQIVTLPEIPVASGDTGVTRQTWENCTGNQLVQPLQYFRPTSLDETLSIIRLAASKNCRLKAIGSGHSFSDVAVTTDFLVDTHGLNQKLDIEEDLLKDPRDASHLFKSECGILIKDLNSALDAAGLALMNMGGYDGQTIIGAISTSTHGSGLGLEPLSSAVASLTLAAADGRVYQIEPAAGITDPVKFNAKHPEIVLKQDDDWFHSTVVSLGCMGVVYSVTLWVIPKYWLSETRALSTWEAARTDLTAGNVLIDNRHYEVLINPYQVNGARTCLVTKRNIANQPVLPSIFRPNRQIFSDLIAQLPGATDAAVLLFNEFPQLTPGIINSAMGKLVDDGYVDLSYKVLNLGGANDISAYSCEIGFPLTTYLEAVDRILEIAEENRVLGNVYHTSPFSLRFVKASEDYMSMQYGADTCMVEIPMVNGSIGGKEILSRYETAMYAFGGRPHWGQLNFVTGNHGLIQSMYPKYDAWLSVFSKLNASGMFDNSFTDRCGFSGNHFIRQ
jgi:L-gulono-1,4-lactone dehydrogenase